MKTTTGAELTCAILLLIVAVIYCTDTPLFTSSVQCITQAQQLACPYVHNQIPIAEMQQLGFSFPHLAFLCHGYEHDVQPSADPIIISSFAPILFVVFLPFFLVEHTEFLSAIRTSYLSLLACLTILHVVLISYCVDIDYWIWSRQLSGLCSSDRSYTATGIFVLFFLCLTATLYLGIACWTRNLNFLGGVEHSGYKTYTSERLPFLNDIILLPNKWMWRHDVLEYQTLVSIAGLLLLVTALSADVGPTQVQVTLQQEPALWRAYVLPTASPLAVFNLLEPEYLFTPGWQPAPTLSLSSDGADLRLGLTVRLLFIFALVSVKLIGLAAPALRLINDVLCIITVILFSVYAAVLHGYVDILAEYGYAVHLEFRTYAVVLAILGVFLHTAGSLGSTRWSYLDSTYVEAKVPDRFVTQNESLPIVVRRLFVKDVI